VAIQSELRIKVSMSDDNQQIVNQIKTSMLELADRAAKQAVVEYAREQHDAQQRKALDGKTKGGTGS
jgi:hypothetical protein